MNEQKPAEQPTEDHEARFRQLWEQTEGDALAWFIGRTASPTSDPECVVCVARGIAAKHLLAMIVALQHAGEQAAAAIATGLPQA